MFKLHQSSKELFGVSSIESELEGDEQDNGNVTIVRTDHCRPLATKLMDLDCWMFILVSKG